MWIRRLLSSFFRPPASTDLGDGDIDWLKGLTVDSAFLFSSSGEYFSIAVTALNAMGARRLGLVPSQSDTLVDNWQLPSGRVVYLGYRVFAPSNSLEAGAEHNSPFLFPECSNPSYAGLVLALCFDCLGELENPARPKTKAASSQQTMESAMITMLGVLSAKECDQHLTQESCLNVVEEFFSWAKKFKARPPQDLMLGLLETVQAAAATLKAHWRTGADGHVRFLQPLFALSAADGILSDTERQLTLAIASVMGISESSFDRALRELHKAGL